MPYGMRLLECLLASKVTVWLLYSQAAQVVTRQETDWLLPGNARVCAQQLQTRFGVTAQQLKVFGKDEWFAPPASGSNPADAMVICPASMGVTASVAAGTSEHLIERAADVCIKERRPLIMVPRETPLSVIHLENMLKLARMGVCILPPNPGFYQQPKSIADLIDFVVARILNQLQIPHQLMPRWGETDLS